MVQLEKVSQVGLGGARDRSGAGHGLLNTLWVRKRMV